MRIVIHVTLVTAQEMINQPLEAEPTKLEKQAAVNVVTRLLHHSNDQVVRLPTGGTVSC